MPSLMLAKLFRGNDGHAGVLGRGVVQGFGFSSFLMAMTVVWSIFCN